MNCINRAISFCPNCGTEQEVWFRYGKVVPTELSECYSCETIYEPSDFILKLLELRESLTVSCKLQHTK